MYYLMIYFYKVLCTTIVNMYTTDLDISIKYHKRLKKRCFNDIQF